jgi:hypothetical protein
MPAKFILHIGPPKTGTSSLQEALAQNRDQLLAQGYDYPGFGRHPEMPQLPGHHGVAESLQQRQQLPDGFAAALSQLPDDHRVIFSSENFAHLKPEAVQQLVQALGPDNVEVIYYARRWEQLLPSVWQELIKHGHSQSYLEFLNHQTSAPLASVYLNYMNVLDRWAGAAGVDRLRIFSYDNLRTEGLDVVQHFCTRVLGIQLHQPQPRQDNPRQTVGRSETLRMLNWLAFGGRGGSPKVRMALEQHRAQLHQELADLDVIYEPYIRRVRLCAPFVFPHVERRFLRLYGDRVENLAADGRLFQDREILAAPYVHPNYMLEEGAVPRLRQLLVQIGQRGEGE